MSVIICVHNTKFLWPWSFWINGNHLPLLNCLWFDETLCVVRQNDVVKALRSETCAVSQINLPKLNRWKELESFNASLFRVTPPNSCLILVETSHHRYKSRDLESFPSSKFWTSPSRVCFWSKDLRSEWSCESCALHKRSLFFTQEISHMYSN